MSDQLCHQMSKVTKAYHERLWHSTATNKVDRWLSWKPMSDGDDASTDGGLQSHVQQAGIQVQFNKIYDAPVFDHTLYV